MIRYLALYFIILTAFVSAVMADFDGDGKYDLFSVNETNGNLSMYEGTGQNNTLVLAITFTNDAQAVTVGNFDGDGQPDMFVGRTAVSGRAMTWYEGNNIDNASTMVNSSVSGYVFKRNGLAIGDIDGDGLGELFGVAEDGTLLRWDSSGDNQITGQVWSSGVNSVAIGDLDSDGRDELFIIRADKIEWIEFRADGTSWYKTILNSGSEITGAKSVKIGDFDGDFNNDMLVVAGDGTILWFESAGNDALPTYVTSFGTLAVSAELCDIDADGTTEVMVGRGSDNDMAWFESNADSTVVEVSGDGIWAGHYDLASSGFTRGNIQLPAIAYRRIVTEANSLPDGSNDIEFPAWATSEDVPGKLMLSFMMGVHPGGERGLHLISDNLGLTWGGPGSQLGYLTYTELAGIGPSISLGFEATILTARTATNVTGYRWADSMMLEIKESALTFPFDIVSAWFHRGLIPLADGTLLATCIIKQSGATTYETVLMESPDMGITWTYRSTVATRQSWMGDEGPNESALCELKNGNLLCVARTGTISNFESNESHVPMIYMISSDKGLTWSAPVSFGVCGVDPGLVVLDDGRIVLSYGRPGVHIKIGDPTGNNWSAPFTIWDGAGCGYTAIAKHADGDVLIGYTESDFNNRLVPYWVNPGDKNYLKMVKVAVSSNCNDLGYNEADINFDCAVNMEDFSILARNWMQNN